MKLAKLALVAALGAAAFTNSGVALADKTNYAGSNCVKFHSGHVTPSLSYSRIYNSSTTRDMYVDCPIEHSEFGGWPGNDNFEDADVGIIDDSTVRNARCWFYGVRMAGTNLYAWTGGTRYSSSAGLHEQNLDFGGVNGANDTWHYIGCQVPRRQAGRTRSAITFYSASE